MVARKISSRFPVLANLVVHELELIVCIRCVEGVPFADEVF